MSNVRYKQNKVNFEKLFGLPDRIKRFQKPQLESLSIFFSLATRVFFWILVLDYLYLFNVDFE